MDDIGNGEPGIFPLFQPYFSDWLAMRFLDGSLALVCAMIWAVYFGAR